MPRTLCVIPARSGSVRIPHKNRKLFHGKPIICYSIETALKSRLFDEVIVSTDDEDIADIAEAAGASIFWRDPDDGSRGTQEVAAEVLGERDDCSIACVLYATAPLLDWRDLARGWRAVISLDLVDRPYAHSVMGGTIDDIGGFYWGFAQAFVEGHALNSIHTAVDPSKCCDINTEADWTRAEEMYGRLHGA